MKMKLGMEVDLSPGHIVLDEDPTPQGVQPPQFFGPCLLWPNGWMDQDAIRYAASEVGLGPDHIVLDGAQLPLETGTAAPALFSAHVCCGQTVAHLSYC